jgi:hypothetical protein
VDTAPHATSVTSGEYRDKMAARIQNDYAGMSIEVKRLETLVHSLRQRLKYATAANTADDNTIEEGKSNEIDEMQRMTGHISLLTFHCYHNWHSADGKRMIHCYDDMICYR